MHEQLYKAHYRLTLYIVHLVLLFYFFLRINAIEMEKILKDSPAATRETVLKNLLDGEVCDRPAFHNHKAGPQDTLMSSCRRLLGNTEQMYTMPQLGISITLYVVFVKTKSSLKIPPKRRRPPWTIQWGVVKQGAQRPRDHVVLWAVRFMFGGETSLFWGRLCGYIMLATYTSRIHLNGFYACQLEVICSCLCKCYVFFFSDRTPKSCLRTATWRLWFRATRGTCALVSLCILIHLQRRSCEDIKA